MRHNPIYVPKTFIVIHIFNSDPKNVNNLWFEDFKNFSIEILLPWLAYFSMLEKTATFSSSVYLEHIFQTELNKSFKKIPIKPGISPVVQMLLLNGFDLCVYYSPISGFVVSHTLDIRIIPYDFACFSIKRPWPQITYCDLNHVVSKYIKIKLNILNYVLAQPPPFQKLRATNRFYL